MVLDTTFEIQVIDYAARRFVIVDTTGLYSATNPTGYGGANPARQDFYFRWVTTLKTYKNSRFVEQPLTLQAASVGYEAALILPSGGFVKLLLYASLVYSPLVFTYTVGEVLWHKTENAYVRIVATPVSAAASYEDISVLSIQTVQYAFIKEVSYFYTLEVEKTMADMLLTLPVTEPVATTDWMKAYEKTRLEAALINLLLCRGYQNTALQLLSAYQTTPYTDC